MTLLLEPETLANGSRVFPDDQKTERFYFETGGEINVSKFAFKKGLDTSHQYVCEVNFSLAEREKELHGSLFSTGKTILIPWESAMVKIWSISDDGVKLLSKGYTSGFGSHNSVHRASPNFLPGEVYLTTELVCKCSSNASTDRFEWLANREQVFPELMAETTRMTHLILDREDVFTPHSVALRAVEAVRKKGLLALDVSGSGATWLDQQLMIQLASAWVDIAYMGSFESCDPAPSDLQVKCLMPTIPDLKKINSSPLKYRHPILFRLGKVLGD